MKVLYHHRTTAQDGSAVHISGLVNALRQLGVDVIMAAPEPSSSVPTRGATSLLRNFRRIMPRWLHELAELVFNVPEAIGLARAVLRYRPTLIYQRSNLYLLSGLWVSRLLRVPLVCEINAPYFVERSKHGGIALATLANWTEEAVWRGADVAIAVTGALAEIVNSAGVPMSRLHVMPNGIDLQTFGPHAIDPGARSRLGLHRWTVLGFTGYVREWNGLEAVVDFLTTPVGRDCYLLIVGDGPARAGLEARAASLQVDRRVRFTGVVRTSAVATYVSAFDIALQPAANPYASPLKLFEYMALQRAIVAPDQPNIREILHDGCDVLLFKAGDPAALTAAISRLVADPALRRRLGERAGRTVESRSLTWLRNAERVIELCREPEALRR